MVNVETLEVSGMSRGEHERAVRARFPRPRTSCLDSRTDLRTLKPLFGCTLNGTPLGIYQTRQYKEICRKLSCVKRSFFTGGSAPWCFVLLDTPCMRGRPMCHLSTKCIDGTKGFLLENPFEVGASHMVPSCRKENTA